MVSFEFIKKSFDLPLKTFETFTNVKKQKVNVGISKKKSKYSITDCELDVLRPHRHF